MPDMLIGQFEPHDTLTAILLEGHIDLREKEMRQKKNVNLEKVTLICEREEESERKAKKKKKCGIKCDFILFFLFFL